MEGNYIRAAWKGPQKYHFFKGGKQELLITTYNAINDKEYKAETIFII
jgi:hypothetical protein